MGGIYLRKLIICTGIILSLILLVIVFLFSKGYFLKQNNQLSYEYNQSNYHEFYFENGYVVFRDEINVRNNTPNDLKFYMYADVSEDSGIAIENTAIAYKQNSLEKEKFFIKANSEQTYMVYFKAKKGEKDTKLSRLPPKRIAFEITE